MSGSHGAFDTNPGASGAQDAIQVPTLDPNNAAFSAWPVYMTGTTYTATQMAAVRSIQLNLTAAGTVTFTDSYGNQMALPYAAAGIFQLPLVPVRVDFSNGAAGSLWMLR